MSPKMKAYKLGVLAAVAETVYVLLVVFGMSQLAEKSASQPDKIWMPIIFLLTLVFSVAVSGVVVFGYPVYLLINKEVGLAVKTVLLTLLSLLIIIGVGLCLVFIFAGL